MIGDGRGARWQGWFDASTVTAEEAWGDPGRVFELPAALDRDAGAGHDDGAQLSGGSETVSGWLARKGVRMGSLFTGDIEVLEVEGQAQPVRSEDELDELEGNSLFWKLAREMGLPGTLLSGVEYKYFRLGNEFPVGGKALRRAALQVGVLPMATVQANDEARQRAAARTVRGASHGDVRVEASDSTEEGTNAVEGTGSESKAAERTNAADRTAGEVNAPQNTHGEGDEALDTTLGLLTGMRGLSDEKVRELLEAWEDEGGSFEG